VADFFEDAQRIGVCLWCGRFDQSNYDAHCSELVNYVMQATSEIECRANDKMAIEG